MEKVHRIDDCDANAHAVIIGTLLHRRLLLEDCLIGLEQTPNFDQIRSSITFCRKPSRVRSRSRIPARPDKTATSAKHSTTYRVVHFVLRLYVKDIVLLTAKLLNADAGRGYGKFSNVRRTVRPTRLTHGTTNVFDIGHESHQVSGSIIQHSTT